MGRATVKLLILIDTEDAISIHALRGEGDEHGFVKLYNKQKISIHALRGEGDANARFTPLSKIISIHALRGEGDSFSIFCPRMFPPFQSTPSVGRATVDQSKDDINRAGISIHALRGEGDIAAYAGATES